MAAADRTRPPDPSGRRALFSTPDDGAAPARPARERASRPSPGGEGRQALFSAAPRADGTVLVECSSCQSRTPVPVATLWRHLLPSAWIPMRTSFPVWMHCPSCGQRTWCDVRWGAVLRGLRRR